MTRAIPLPLGHDWKETDSYSAAVVMFQCDRCTGTFAHSLEDGSIVQNPGDDPDACPDGDLLDYAE